MRVPALTVALLLASVLFCWGRAAAEDTVVAYCAQDQVYAEPIFHEFEQQTRLRVRAVYDSEAVKTVGIANRLLAESRYPRCDVFWGNEELRTRQLAARDIWRHTNGWTSFGYRSRRIVINTNLLSLATAPHSLLELTNSTWRGRLALANPQFGTTATHFLALRQAWGESAWQTWCRALAANRPMRVDGNSVVVKLVGAGEAVAGLTDSDDIADGRREGLPILELPLMPAMLLIPNTVAVVRGAPHSQAAERLFQFLQQRTVSARLIAGQALEGYSVTEVTVPTLKVDWDALLRDLQPATEKLNQIFLR